MLIQHRKNVVFMKKRSVAGRFISLGIAVVLLIVGISVGFKMDVFKNFKDVAGTVHFNGTVFLKIIIVIALLFAINAVLQLLFGLFRGKTGRVGTMGAVVASLVKYAIVIVGFCWVLTLIGVNVSTIFASLGIVALVLGFGAESLVADVVTGIFILFENQFNVGDIIEVNGFRGTVESIGIRTISLKDTGGNTKIINNSDLKNIINRSESGSVAVCEIGVSYNTDLENFEKRIGAVLKNIKEKNSTVFIGDVSYLGVEELGDSQVVLKFKADVEEKNLFSGRRLLNKELKCAFDKEGFEIPFPQVDVHNR